MKNLLTFEDFINESELSISLNEGALAKKGVAELDTNMQVMIDSAGSDLDFKKKIN